MNEYSKSINTENTPQHNYDIRHGKHEHKWANDQIAHSKPPTSFTLMKKKQ